MRKRAREMVRMYGEFGSDTWVIACLYYMDEPRVLTRDDIYEWMEQYPHLFVSFCIIVIVSMRTVF